MASLTALLMVLALAVPLANAASAQTALTVQAVTPDDEGDGPGIIVSDNAGNGQTDGLYHLVARTTGTPDSVTALIDTDDDGTNEFVIPLSQVEPGLWEGFLDLTTGDATFAFSIGTVTYRAVAGATAADDTEDAFFGSGDIFGINNTVDITVPENGGELGFFGGTALIEGVVSEPGTEVEVFYTTDPASATGDAPEWTSCGSTIADGDGNWTADCGPIGDNPADVTAVAAQADSGDAHVVDAYAQTVASGDEGFTLEHIGTVERDSVGFCNTYVVTVTDQRGNPIAGANVDVHGSASDNSADAWRFAENFATEGEESDPFRAPNDGDHDDTEAAFQCDSADERDESPDDQDGDAGPDQALHTTTDPDTEVTTTDSKHIEGETLTDGQFQFSVTANEPVSISLTAWLEGVPEGSGDNDTQDGGERSESTTKPFEEPQGLTLEASPDSETNPTADATVRNCDAGSSESCHEVHARVFDRNGRPVNGETVIFEVTSGPNADTVFDFGGDTQPAGRFDTCTTGDESDGHCDGTYESSEEGTDSIRVFVDSNDNGVFDSGEPNETVTKTWVDVSAVGCIDLEPNTATGQDGANPTDSTHELTVFVTDGGLDEFDGDGTDETDPYDFRANDDPGVNDCTGNALEGIPVDLFIRDDDPDTALVPDVDEYPAHAGDDDDYERVVTGSDGSATITLDNVADEDDDEGETRVEALVPGTDAVDNEPDDAIKEWQDAGLAENFECEPDFDTNPQGSDHTLTFTVTDFFGDGVSGLNVDFRVITGPHANNDLDGDTNTPAGYIGEDTTDTNGQATQTYTGSELGEDEIRCWVDENGNDRFESAQEDDDVVEKEWIEASVFENATIAIDVDPSEVEFADYNDVDCDSTNSCGPFSEDHTRPAIENDAECTSDLADLRDRTESSPSQHREDWNLTQFVYDIVDRNGDAFTDWDEFVGAPVNGVELICVTAVNDGGTPDDTEDDTILFGAEVTLTQTSGVGFLTDEDGPELAGGTGPGFEDGDTTQTKRINEDGYALFYHHSTQAGDAAFEASVDGVTDTDTASKQYMAVGNDNDHEGRIVECSPVNATNPPGTNHTVTCFVHDGFGNPVQSIGSEEENIGYSVVDSDGANTTFVSTDNTTDANGEAQAVITSDSEGTSEVTGTIDDAVVDEDAECDERASEDDGYDYGKPAGVCNSTVTKTWSTAQFTIDLTPADATNDVGTDHTVTANVQRDGADEQDVTVRFSVSGANSASGAEVTDANGDAPFTYTGDNAGDDTITAFADLNGDGLRQSNEPRDTATKTWETADGEPGPGPTPDDEGAVRLSGADRFLTAIEISQDAYPDGGAGAVVLARDDVFADALAGTPFAVQENAPLLLTQTGELRDVVADEIQRVAPEGSTVYLLGGNAALSQNVRDQVQALGYNPVRVFGFDRFETAVEIAGELGDPSTLMVATGFEFVDALTAGPAAINADAAILLTHADTMTDTTQDYLDDRSGEFLYAIGGPHVNAYAESAEADESVYGADRFKTAVAVATEFFNVPSAVGIARSDVFADALTGGVHIGRFGGPMLVTASDFLQGDIEGYLCDNSDSIDVAYLYGGTVALSTTVENDVQARIDGTGC